MRHLRILLLGLFAVICVFSVIPQAWAFCGFYVAGADAELYNQASQVAIARNSNQTVLTMANDYKGNVADFALVVPVPTILQREQVRVVEPELLTRLDAYSAPRVVEYPDDIGTCDSLLNFFLHEVFSGSTEPLLPNIIPQGVTVESTFAVGEYDIAILSAQESDGLETWLQRNNYQIPAGASEVLQSYIRQGMKFFVAKVNLSEFDNRGFQPLRPLQITYDSPRFMLPIRLGMVNAEGAQDLIVYLLSPRGRTEVINYRTVGIPTNINVPGFVANNFDEVYEAIFQKAHAAANNAILLEYAANLNFDCYELCSAGALTVDELQNLGASWIQPSTNDGQLYEGEAFLTRLHVRYTRGTFPEDLSFYATHNQGGFLGVYVIRYNIIPKITFEQCIEDVLETLRWFWEDERSLGNTAEDFPTFLKTRVEALIPSSPFFRRVNYPIPTETDDPIEYINRLGRAMYASNEEQIILRLEEESRSLAQVTGWPLEDIRQRITEETPNVPELWRRRYPPRQ
ncbi:MAG: DUF2330 domain-containing protein [Leptolyngbya sp. SIO1E4]|nr:DUF2330 domain-containing protein [Leptolyngbya sp. SIO1E4]